MVRSLRCIPGAVGSKLHNTALSNSSISVRDSGVSLWLLFLLLVLLVLRVHVVGRGCVSAVRVGDHYRIKKKTRNTTEQLRERSKTTLTTCSKTESTVVLALSSAQRRRINKYLNT